MIIRRDPIGKHTELDWSNLSDDHEKGKEE